MRNDAPLGWVMEEKKGGVAALLLGAFGQLASDHPSFIS